jgi:hypothetical protein
VDGVISDSVSYDKRPEDLSEVVSDTLSETTEISGKSIQSLYIAISLFKLSSEELSDPTHPVSIAMKKMRDIPEIRIIEGKTV